MSNWRTIGSIVFGALLVIGGIADVVTIRQFGFHLWEPITGGTAEEGTTPPIQLAPPHPTPTGTATPTPVPPLSRQLEEALSVSSSSARSKALSLVAQNAVVLGDYRTAIRAASATPSSSAQAENLEFVVKCAIEDRLYNLAADAADEIKTTSSRDRLKIEVIEARRWAGVGDETRPRDVMRSDIDRNSMTCFDFLTK